MADAFRPSQISLAVPPLCGTMEKAEREFAAALIVRACQVLGDEWKPVSFDALSGSLETDLANGVDPIASLLRNPFFRPDFWLLADGKFGRWIDKPGESSIELTARGLEALRPWVRS